MGTHRLVLPHEDFVYLRNSIDFLEYDLIDPVTNLPITLSALSIEPTANETQSTLQQWTDACTVQGNNEEWHDGDWTEGVSPTSKISYNTWGCLGHDIWNTTGYAYWKGFSINPISSKVRILFKLMGIEGDLGDYVDIYLWSFDSGEWIYKGTVTDKSDHVVSLTITVGIQTYVASNGTCYFYAKSNDGFVFDWVHFEYECPTPSAPSLSAPSNGATCVTYSSTYFDWGSISGVGGYEINISPGGTYWTPNSYYNKNLSQNTTYTWKVRAENPCGWGTWSSTRTFTTKGTPGKPSLSSPSNGATCVASPVSFDWASVSGATEYQIYISPGGTYTTSSSNYSRTLNPGTTYTWKVRAKNSCNVWGNWSSSRTFTTTGTPGTPSLVSPSNGEENVNPNPVSFDWSSVSGATQYEINISPGGTYTANTSNYSRTLSEGTTYSWRVRAKNSCNIWGDWSITWNFTTGDGPTVATGTASNVTTTSATLNGTVNPNGLSTTCYFEYGTTTSYDSQTSTQDIGSGTSNVSVNADLSELILNTTYHFRLVASNSAGTSNGNDQTFTTSSEPVPTVVTGTASNVSATSATLNGTVNPNGSSADYYFEYGTSTSYGNQTSTKNAGSGTSNVSVSTSVSGLSPNTEYHFQLVASNSGGTTEGNDQTFTTNTVSVDDQHDIPISYELKPAYPNPFNPEVTLSFSLPKATRITIVVYDIWGREVYRLVDGFFGPGNHKVGWRGTYEDGKECPSGIYIARMVTPEFSRSIKLVKMK